VRRSLELNDLITEQDDVTKLTIEIELTSIRARSNFTAVLFGFMAGDDHVDGDVVVRGADGKVLQQFSVSASYALGGLAGGQDSVRMDWLYESFAENMTNELTGKTGEQANQTQN